MRIEARYEAGQVVVEIEDDGKGIDAKRVADSALSKGLITAEKLKGMSDQDKVALIFLPGLSTAEKLTDVSGRGVGMDVVKTNLDRLGGKVEIKSEMGKGSLFRIKLPLTLAIIPSLIVSVEGERFALPQINVEELLRIRAEDVKRRVEVVGGSTVLLLRERIIPIVQFDALLGVVPSYVDPRTGMREVDRRTSVADRRSPRRGLDTDNEESAAEIELAMSRRVTDGRRGRVQSDLEIAVVTTGTMQYGLVVGGFHDTEEIVVKPLGRHLKGMREYAGATILGDGTVALILDVAGLAAKANLTPVSGSARAIEQAQAAERERLQDNHALFLFQNAADERCAISLDTVLRIEKIDWDDVENMGSRRAMQYRGAVLLPLVTPRGHVEREAHRSVARAGCDRLKRAGAEVGILAAMPVDVVETKTEIDQVTHRQKGIAGSAIIQERTTLVVDLFELVETTYPDWGQTKPLEERIGIENAGKSILLAEDSDFFRSQVKRYLQDDGYTVLDAPDGEAAWELLLQHAEEVLAVVTDIEMPRLTGLGLVQRIRAEARTNRLPVIALTSLASEDDMVRGKAAGIDEYQVKLDRDRLLESVHALALR